MDDRTALDALRTVMDPELHRDLVSLGMVKDLAVDGDRVRLKVELTTPACPLKDTIGRNVEAALRAAGFKRVEIAWGAQVRSAPGASQGELTPGVKNIVLVGAGKGGVGKSTVAVNIAVALARLGAQVGILDADVYGPSVPILTGITGKPVSSDGQRLESLHRPRHQGHVHRIPGGAGPGPGLAGPDGDRRADTALAGCSLG